MSVKVYYKCPAGTPPMAFPFAGRNIVVMPPDQYWKVEVEEYVIGAEPDPRASPLDPQEKRFKARMGKREYYALDKEKNELMAQGVLPKPRGYVFMSDGAFREAKKSKWRGLGQFLIKETDMVRDHENEVAALEREHSNEIERLMNAKKKLEAAAASIVGDKVRAVEQVKAQLKQEALEQLQEELKREYEQERQKALADIQAAKAETLAAIKSAATPEAVEAVQVAGPRPTPPSNLPPSLIAPKPRK